jgi:hypothetical protein
MGSNSCVRRLSIGEVPNNEEQKNSEKVEFADFSGELLGEKARFSDWLPGSQSVLTVLLAVSRRRSVFLPTPSPAIRHLEN